MTHAPIFITGTGTDVGKTVVAGALAWAMKASYWKPVQTGDTSDAAAIANWTADTVSIDATVRHDPLPASPDQAALAARRRGLTVSELALEFQRRPRGVIEGAGGLLVPLNEQAETWADFLQAIPIPVLIVAPSGLGTLNHTALSFEVAHARGIRVIGIVLNGPRHAANELSLSRLLPGVPVYAFPQMETLGQGDETWCSVATGLGEWTRRLIAESSPQFTTWADLDRAHTWHPYTQHATAAAPTGIVSARGAWLNTTGGERLLDGIGSWWVNTVGHGRPEIRNAIARQQSILDHTLFAGVAHEPAARLAHRVVTRVGAPFTRVFFSDNGSTAVEIAVKMLVQRWAQAGEEQRRLLVCLEGGYHGDTFGAMAAGRGSGFFEPFAPYLFETLRVKPVTSHASRVCPEGASARSVALAAWSELL